MALRNLELEHWMAKRLGHSRRMSRNVNTCSNTKPKATCQLISAREHRVTSKQRAKGGILAQCKLGSVRINLRNQYCHLTASSVA